MLVVLDLQQGALFRQPLYQAFATFEAIQSGIGASLRSHFPVVVDYGYSREVVPEANLIVVRVVRGSYLDRSGAKGSVNKSIGNHRQLSTDNRKSNSLPDNVPVPLVLGMDCDSRVAQHGLGPRGCDRNEAGAINQRVIHIP